MSPAYAGLCRMRCLPWPANSREKPASSHGRLKFRETRTLRWREPDSNHWSHSLPKVSRLLPAGPISWTGVIKHRSFRETTMVGRGPPPPRPSLSRRDRWFESIFLQRGVCELRYGRTPDPGGGGLAHQRREDAGIMEYPARLRIRRRRSPQRLPPKVRSGQSYPKSLCTSFARCGSIIVVPVLRHDGSGCRQSAVSWKRLGPVVDAVAISLGRRVSECWLWAASVASRRLRPFAGPKSSGKVR
jgi:hypothetical protein